MGQEPVAGGGERMRGRVSSLFLGRTQPVVKPQPADEAHWQLDVLPAPVLAPAPAAAGAASDKNLKLPGSLCFSCTARNSFHYRAGRQEPTHPGGRVQAGQGHGTTADR